MFYFSGVYYKSDINVMQQAIENAITVWAHGMNALMEDTQNRPRLTNVSLTPSLECETGNIHWKNGRILYE